MDVAAQHGATRVAFPALGAGSNAVAPADRMLHVVRAARDYMEVRFAEARALNIEEVLVCDPSVAALAKVRQDVAGLVRSAPAIPARSPRAAPVRSAAGQKRNGAPRASTRRAAPRLDADSIAQARASAKAYDRTQAYQVGDWFIHPKFGVGRVEAVFPERMITVLFEDAEQRKMVHAR